MTRKEIILDKNIKVIYNKLENIKLNQGYVDLSSSSIQNKNDLVDVCNIFRDPRYETFRIFYMKDNKIVGILLNIQKIFLKNFYRTKS